MGYPRPEPRLGHCWHFNPTTEKGGVWGEGAVCGGGYYPTQSSFCQLNCCLIKIAMNCKWWFAFVFCQLTTDQRHGSCGTFSEVSFRIVVNNMLPYHIKIIVMDSKITPANQNRYQNNSITCSNHHHHLGCCCYCDCQWGGGSADPKLLIDCDVEVWGGGGEAD